MNITYHKPDSSLNYLGNVDDDPASSSDLSAIRTGAEDINPEDSIVRMVKEILNLNAGQVMYESDQENTIRTKYYIGSQTDPPKLSTSALVAWAFGTVNDTYKTTTIGTTLWSIIKGLCSKMLMAKTNIGNLISSVTTNTANISTTSSSVQSNTSQFSTITGNLFAAKSDIISLKSKLGSGLMTNGYNFTDKISMNQLSNNLTSSQASTNASAITSIKNNISSNFPFADNHSGLTMEQAVDANKSSIDTINSRVFILDADNAEEYYEKLLSNSSSLWEGFTGCQMNLNVGATSRIGESPFIVVNYTPGVEYTHEIKFKWHKTDDSKTLLFPSLNRSNPFFIIDVKKSGTDVVDIFKTNNTKYNII